MYSLNGLSVALVFITRSLPWTVSLRTSYGKNKEYNSLVISAFDKEKWDAMGVVFITFVDLLKRNKSIQQYAWTQPTKTYYFVWHQ